MERNLGLSTRGKSPLMEKHLNPGSDPKPLVDFLSFFSCSFAHSISRGPDEAVGHVTGAGKVEPIFRRYVDIGILLVSVRSYMPGCWCKQQTTAFPVRSFVVLLSICISLRIRVGA